MTDRATEVVLYGAAAWLATMHPEAGIAAAASAPTLVDSIKSLAYRIEQRRADKVDQLLKWSSKFANVELGDLLSRCYANPEVEELLLKVLRATEDTTLRGKILSFAMSLAKGTSPGMSDASLRWEKTFVRVVDDLDPVHLELLDRFTWTSNQLGLGNGAPEFDEVPAALNLGQVEMVTMDLDILPSLLAVLQRHGLIASTDTGGGPLGGSGSTYWKVTSFGCEVLGRFALIRSVVTGP